MKLEGNTKIFLAPFIFIISFIRHFFIGVKFIFFDVWKNIFGYQKAKKDFRKREKNGIEKANSNNVTAKKEDLHVLTYAEKERINREKNNLIKEIQAEAKMRKINKEYYTYYGTDQNGKKIKGTMSATNKITLHNFLASEGINVYKVEKNNLANFLKKIGFEREHELSTIKLMTKQASKDPNKKKIYQAISYELTLGENFSTALASLGNIFPSLLINMIKSAEATGEIIKTLDDMAEYYTEVDKTRKEMISAIIYPTILLVFATAVLTFIMIYVIPEFIKVYNNAGITVSGFTLTIINISKFMTSNINILIVILLVVILTTLIMYRNVKSFRKSIQTIGMRIPFFGKIIIYHEITLFTKTFASLLKNSVYITSSMEILTNITNNEVYKDIMIETISNIASGEKISLSFENKWCIPDVAYYMIVTGESTGELSLMMEKVANYYSDLHKSKVTNLKSFLEPIMIVILALIVGIIILAVVIPMFSLYGQIS